MKQVLLKLGLLAGILSAASAISAHDITNGGVCYTFSDDHRSVFVSGYDGVSGDLVIPSTVEHDGKKYEVTAIGSRAFYRCTAITSVEIPVTVNSMEESAFEWCESLRSAKITGPLTSIPENAFAGCSDLASLDLPSTVTSIGQRAFWQCELESFAVPGSITTIGDFAFSGSRIRSGKMPESLASIGRLAFQECGALASVELPASVTSIGGGAFSGCKNLKEITVVPENGKYCSSEGVLYTKDMTELIQAPAGKMDFTAMPSSVTSIGEYAFSNCMYLTSVELPSSVRSIGINAFWSCRGLVSVIFPSSLVEIGNWAFSGCWNLESIDLPNSVTSIGKGAFYSCQHLKSVKLPNAITSIAEETFYWCDDLTSIIIPSSVTSIGDRAFEKCLALSSVEIPSSVVSIGKWAFNNCNGLVTVEIPKSVESIGDRAFGACFGLTAFAVDPENAYYTSIDGVLYNKDVTTLIQWPLKKNTEVRIPASVTTIGLGAFQSCDFLTSFDVPVTVTTIGEEAFSGCYYLTSVSIPASVKTIGVGAFRYCSQLETAVICSSSSPDRVSPSADGRSLNARNDETAEIGDNAFEACRKLESVVIGPNVKSIGQSAFTECGLASITCEALVPPVAGEYTFDAIAYETALLTVPGQSYDSYRSAEVWKNFINTTAGIDETEIDVRVDDKAEYFDLHGQRVGPDHKGIVIIRHSDGSSEKTIRK